MYQRENEASASDERMKVLDEIKAWMRERGFEIRSFSLLRKPEGDLSLEELLQSIADQVVDR